MDAPGKAGGFFISFEGPEGGGKSTQIHRLAAALAEEGHVVWTTREPGGTRVGEMIRPLLLGAQQSRVSPWTEALLFTAARAELNSRYGRTAASWSIDDAAFSLEVVIPPNATATVTLPDGAVTDMGSGERSFACAYG